MTLPVAANILMPFEHFLMTKLKEREQSIIHEFINNAIDIAKKIDNSDAIAKAYLEISTFFLKKGEIDRALDYARVFLTPRGFICSESCEALTNIMAVLKTTRTSIDVMEGLRQ